MRPGQYLTRSLVYVDNRGVDGLVNGLAALFGGRPAGSAACRPASSVPTHSPWSSAPHSWSSPSWR